MKKTQVQRHLSLRCKIKAECVELCIIDNTSGAIQYEIVPINFDILDNTVTDETGIDEEVIPESENDHSEGGKE